MFPREKVEGFVLSLLEWAKSNTRDFPWRRTEDPYKILVAEIMLQRTRAEQVMPVYVRFIKKYPDFHSLAKASVSELRTMILSLGLEKRARGLKRLAVQIEEQHGGKIPNNIDELLKLYGIGNYIANAILCHAFGVDVLTVDANFARILDRVFSLKLKQPAQKDKRIWNFAGGLMPHAKDHARELNLSIIDFASKICAPRKPSCRTCPLKSICDYGIVALVRLDQA